MVESFVIQLYYQFLFMKRSLNHSFSITVTIKLKKKLKISSRALNPRAKLYQAIPQHEPLLSL